MEKMAIILPKFVALKSNTNNKYLRYVHEEDVEVHGFLQFSGEEVVSPYAKYEVEVAKSGKEGLVHIKCCYNNKYWVRWSQNHWWIVAGADKPEEDQSKWSCTLFEPVVVDGGDAKTVRFRHVQLGHYGYLWPIALPYDSCLFAGSQPPYNDGNDYGACTIIDWERLFILPKHIAFKGDNGNYLKALRKDGIPYLQFAANDIKDPMVGNEVFTTPDGSILIKSDYFGKFWRRSSNNWILADSDDSTGNNVDSDTLFWPTKVDNNAAALRNLGNNNFCKRFTINDKTSYLNAATSNISIYGKLEVEELVISRNITISDVNFRLMYARIYNQSVLMLCINEAYNRTQDPTTTDLKLSYTEISSRTWNANVSVKLGVKTTIRTGVPVIANGAKIEIPTGFSGEYQWGETKKLTTAVETVYKVVVPPMTMVRLSLLATEASCDIPFSYSQHDTLINGNQVTYDMDDGVYTGTNFFNFKYETKEFKL